MKSHYQTLGVSETATDEEIRSAYRRLLQESLMDKERFDAVKQAFEALKTPEKRAAYDQSLRVSEQPETPAPARKSGTNRLSRSKGAADQTAMLNTVSCPVCGHRNAPGEAYCGECGFLLAATAVSDHPLQETSNIDRQPHFVDEDGHKFPLHAGVNTVGREHGDIVLPDKTVSRHHAHVVCDEDRGLYSVEDIDSTNGTSVNGQRLLPRAPHPVFPGDDVQFGSVPLKLAAVEKTSVMPVADSDQTEEHVSTEIEAHLYLVKGTGPEDIPLGAGINSIGRMPNNTVCISGDRYISGHHAMIEVENGIFRLVDLGSTNGTFLNGLRLTTNEAITINEEDEVSIGGCVYIFRQGNEPPADLIAGEYAEVEGGEEAVEIAEPAEAPERAQAGEAAEGADGSEPAEGDEASKPE